MHKPPFSNIFVAGWPIGHAKGKLLATLLSNAYLMPFFEPGGMKTLGVEKVLKVRSRAEWPSPLNSQGIKVLKVKLAQVMMMMMIYEYECVFKSVTKSLRIGRLICQFQLFWA